MMTPGDAPVQWCVCKIRQKIMTILTFIIFSINQFKQNIFIYLILKYYRTPPTTTTNQHSRRPMVSVQRSYWSLWILYNLATVRDSPDFRNIHTTFPHQHTPTGSWNGPVCLQSPEGHVTDGWLMKWDYAQEEPLHSCRDVFNVERAASVRSDAPTLRGQEWWSSRCFSSVFTVKCSLVSGSAEWG